LENESEKQLSGRSLNATRSLATA